MHKYMIMSNFVLNVNKRTKIKRQSQMQEIKLNN